jgi:hypothetical protein
VHRLKGRLVLKSGEVKIIQGVREVFEIMDAKPGAETVSTEEQLGKIVVIGRGVVGAGLEESLHEHLTN